ncbi:MAG: OsmC family protein [Sphingobacteriales bacterium]|nr:OsmC family protein [Sphingobacteriales bacterium]
MEQIVIQTQFNKGLFFTADVQGFPVNMDSNDHPEEQSGPGPKQLMLGALAGCTGIDVVSILNKMKVPFSNLSIEVTAFQTDEHPKIYKEVMVKYHIQLSENDRPKMEKAVLLSQDKYCGVSAMFRAFSAVGHEIIFL